MTALPRHEELIDGPRRFGTAAHAAVLAVAFSIFSWPLSTAFGIAGGVIGAFAGVFAAAELVASRLRLPVVVALALLGLPAAGALGFVIQSSAVTGFLGAEAALVAHDGVRWFFFALCSTSLVRAFALRYRAALAIEGAIVVAAIATTVSAHRDGMIARPLAVADWFWSQGLDPVIAFLGIGLIGATLFAAILAHGRTRARTLLQLAFVLALGIFVAAKIHSADPSSDREQLGQKSGDEKKDEQARGQGGASSSGSGAKNNFEDDLPTAGGGKNRPAAVVVFHREVSPSTGVFYFRHASFSQFNGVRLVEATQPDVDPDGRFDFPTQKSEVPRPPESEARTTVAMDVAMLTHHSRPFGLIDPIELEPMVNPDPARFRRAYRVLSSVLTGQLDELIGRSPGAPEWSDATWRHYTQLPKDPRYKALADGLREKLADDFKTDPIALAMVVKRHLEETTTYSFKKSYEGEQDPTGAFLFGEDRRGYCVHTSHAAAYLIRALGVPARVSAGYALPAANLGGGSSLLIKSSDAHAWAEIHLGGIGWVPVEVTPEKTDVDPSPFAEQDLQQMLGEMARKEGRNEQTKQPRLRAKEIIAFLQRLFPFILAVLLLSAYTIKLYRLLVPRFANPRSLPRVAYRAALDHLASAGLTRETGESRERFRTRVAASVPSFGPLTDAHLASAFGSARSHDDADLRSAPRRVASELRRQRQGWKRMAGALNPVSWMFSK